MIVLTGGIFMLRIAIIDDDAEDRELLHSYIDRFFENDASKYTVYTFSDGEDLLLRYNASYDIVFLDVEMKWSNGIDIAHKIREIDTKTMILFVSRIAQYAVDGYSVSAFDYLLKPVEFASFTIKFQKALNYYQSHLTCRIRIPLDGDYRWISTDEIRYVEVFGHSLIYHTINGNLRSLGTIGSATEQLMPYHFLQTTRFCLVNLKYVTGIEDNSLLLGKDLVPVSRRRKKEIVDALMLFNGGFA